MEYGQSIPPKTVFDKRPQFFTKQGFAHYMAKCLQTVGMLPFGTNTYNLGDAANAERDPLVSENAHFFFDYPTAATFAPGGVSNPKEYRPILAMNNSILRGWNGNGNQNIGSIVGYHVGWNVCFRHARRPATSLGASLVETYRSMYNNTTPNNYKMGNNGDDMGTYYLYEGGTSLGWHKWKLFNSWGDANQQELLFVNRVFVHLGKAGLIVQVGSHPTRRAQTADLLNFAAFFSGGRIPGRARPVLQDPLRDTFDPVVWLDLGTTSTSDYSVTAPYANAANVDLTSALLGGARQFDGAFQPYNYPCNVLLRSIDYLDDAVVFNAPSDVFPRPSPTVINGNGVHALHRACVLPYRRMGTSEFLGRVESVRQPNLQPIHKWEDTFYLPGMALGDRVMTPGPKLDPNTGKNWFSIWANPRGQSFALDYDGVVEVAIPDVPPAAVLQETIPLDLSALASINPAYTRNVTRNGALSLGIPFTTVPGTFGPGVSMKLAQFEHSNIDAVMRWTKGNLTNEFQLNNWGWTSWDGAKYFSLIVDLAGLVANGTYIIEYEYSGVVNTNDVGDPAGPSYYYALEVETGPGSQELSTALSQERYSTARFGSPGFVNVYSNYAAYGSLALPFPAGATTTYRTVIYVVADASGRANVKFQLYNAYSPAYNNMTVRLRNLVLKRYA